MTGEDLHMAWCAYVYDLDKDCNCECAKSEIINDIYEQGYGQGFKYARSYYMKMVQSRIREYEFIEDNLAVSAFKTVLDWIKDLPILKDPND